MALQETVEKNHDRIREISEVHRKEIDKIDHYLGIIDQAKTEKVEALVREHDVVVKQMKAKIAAIEAKIVDEIKAFDTKRENLLTSFEERAASFQLRKKAAEAYLAVAAEVQEEAAVSDTDAIPAGDQKPDTLPPVTADNSSADYSELHDLDIDLPDSETLQKFAA